MSKILPFHYFNEDFSMDDIKIIYLPQPGQVYIPTLVQCQSTCTINPEERKYINEKWKEENDKELAKKGLPLKDEQIVSVSSIDSENGSLEIASSNYKTWKTSAKKGFFQKFGKSNIPNPLNVQILVETMDQQLVVGPRPGKDTLQLPGGMFKKFDLRERQRRIDPVTSAAIREFSEEIAPVAGAPVLGTSCIGTSFYAGRVLTTVYMTGKIEKSVEDLEEYRSAHQKEIKDFKDFPALECIGTSQADIQQALDRAKLQETTMIALLLYGHQKFGHQWLEKHCPPKMLAAHLKEQKTR